MVLNPRAKKHILALGRQSPSLLTSLVALDTLTPPVSRGTDDPPMRWMRGVASRASRWAADLSCQRSGTGKSATWSPYALRRTSVQAAKLELEGTELVCRRDEPFPFRRPWITGRGLWKTGRIGRAAEAARRRPPLPGSRR